RCRLLRLRRDALLRPLPDRPRSLPPPAPRRPLRLHYPHADQHDRAGPRGRHADRLPTQRLLRHAPHRMARRGRFPAPLRRMGAPLPTQRPHRRGPDRTPGPGGRDQHLPHPRRTRLGTALADGEHLEAPQSL
ncbi:MAG: hypothetical protein AVDCRST_MAG13-3621, partial [uncultured Solirubrobacteraceae bacterium]